MTQQRQPINPETLPFEVRVSLVKEEIEKRIRQLPTTNPCYERARMWLRWVNVSVLGGVA